MLKAKQIANDKHTSYATKSDFCQIFDQDINSLYLLSFLLTADHEIAEQCFVSGLGDAVQGNAVFKEWARSWARRMVIQSAVRMVKPRPIEGNGDWSSISINRNDETPPTERVEIAGVLELPTFDRFVFVMSVLERYSDQDCSVLLGCARRDVLAARTRAFQQIGTATESQPNHQGNAGREEPVAHNSNSSLLELQA